MRGSPASTKAIEDHCRDNVGARVFTPSKGEVVDATTETHIYQVRLTDALVSQLDFQKGKDGAELAWIDAQINFKDKAIDARPAQPNQDEAMEGNFCRKTRKLFY